MLDRFFDSSRTALAVVTAGACLSSANLPSATGATMDVGRLQSSPERAQGEMISAAGYPGFVCNSTGCLPLFLNKVEIDLAVPALQKWGVHPIVVQDSALTVNIFTNFAEYAASPAAAAMSFKVSPDNGLSWRAKYGNITTAVAELPYVRLPESRELIVSFEVHGFNDVAIQQTTTAYERIDGGAVFVNDGEATRSPSTMLPIRLIAEVVQPEELPPLQASPRTEDGLTVVRFSWPRGLDGVEVQFKGVGDLPEHSKYADWWSYPIKLQAGAKNEWDFVVGDPYPQGGLMLRFKRD